MYVNDLILNFNNLTDTRILELTLSCYKQIYLNRGRFGVHFAHDGEPVLFHETTFYHAFYTSSKGPPYNARKDKLDRQRAARVRWIKELIEGRLPNSACWEVTARSGRIMPPNRLYVLYAPAYLVWLEPRKNNIGWNFSSAYHTDPVYLTEKTRGGNKIWKYPKEKPGD